MNLPTIDFTSWMPHIWAVVRWFIQMNNPWIMISVALAVCYGVVQIILWIMGFKDDEKKEQDDYDYEEY